jgi:predicted porin
MRAAELRRHAMANALAAAFAVAASIAPGLAQAQAPFEPADGAAARGTVAPLPPTSPRIAVNALQNMAVGQIVVDVAAQAAVADGVSRVAVNVQLLDASGQPLKTPATITIESSTGRILLPGARTDELGPGALDADRTTPGVQMVVDNGRATFWLIAPARPQDVQLRISAGRSVAEGAVAFAPELREMVAAGLVEGVVAMRNKSRDAIQPVRIEDGFEQDIQNWARSFDDGKGAAAGRAAFFLKGRIKGDALLTMAYDSDKDTQMRLFRDVLPDQYYPVYGDASIKGNDAQSSSKLFVRIDQDRNYLMYGDFVTSAGWTPVATPLTGPGGLLIARPGGPMRLRDLGSYSRTVTGAQGHVENERGYGNAFVVNQSLTRAIEEYATNGTSGPFAVKNSAAIVNSEKVELVTRDRNNVSVILRTVPFAPLIDYVFEPFSGRILLTRPVPSRDEFGNPLSLRITYEVDQGGDPFWLYGADGQYFLTPHWQVGGSVVDDRNPLAPYRISSVNTGLQLGPHTQLVAEFARTEGTYNTGTGVDGALTPGLAGVQGEAAGNAGRIALEYDDGTAQVRLYAGKSDKEFNNPSASYNGGRSDAGVRGLYRLDDRTTLFGEAVRSEDEVAGGTRTGAQVGGAYRASERLTFDVALKRVDENGLPVSPAATIPGNPSSATGTATSPLTPSGGFFGTGNNAINPATGTSILAPQTAQPSSGAGTPLEATTVQLGAQYRATEQLTLAGEVESSVTGDDQKRLALGAGYQLSELSRLYGRFETQRGLASVYSLNPADRSTWFVFGADTALTPDTQFYSEYRIASGIGDPLIARDAQLASGLRNTWVLAPGLRLVTGGEYVKVLSGSGQQAVALASAIDYTADPLWKALGRLEWRRIWDGNTTLIDEQQDSVLAIVTVARKLDRDWTLLARNYALWSDFAATGRRWQDRFQVGVAYRDTERNRVNALAKLEYLAESDKSALPTPLVGTIAQPSKRDVGIASVLADWHPSRPWWLTGRLAFKTVDETFDGIVAPRYSAALVSGRAVYDLTERFDVGVLAGYLFSTTGNARQSAYGVEVGAIVQANLRLAVGYNVTGFSDRDMAAADYTAQGWFLRLRFKFDEDILRSGDAAVNRTLDRASGG